MEDFFPKIKWTPTLRCTPESNYWGDADVDHTQTIGGYTVKLLGGIYPQSPPGFGTPDCLSQILLLGAAFMEPASWWSGNAFVSGAVGLRVKSQASQIEYSVANGSPPL